MEQDVVCAIVAGKIPAEVVARTDTVIAFLDIHPLFLGHTLVSPIQHVATLPQLPAELIPDVFGMAQRVAEAMVDTLGADGSFVANNNTVSQSVPHLHVHVIPRHRGDGLKGFFWPRQRYAEGQAAAYGAMLRERLAR